MKKDIRFDLRLKKISTLLGTMVVGSVQGEVCLLDFENSPVLENHIEQCRKLFQADEVHFTDADQLIDTCALQLEEYFNGGRKTFSVPAAIRGTPFQEKVWRKLLTIPYGEYRSYKELAAAVGNGRAVRAAAAAVGANRVLILVPCHRVIGADGTLTGYSAGLDRKKRLLEIENSGRQA
jgi:O-6-methylguanine DNA methyltransferase